MGRPHPALLLMKEKTQENNSFIGTNAVGGSQGDKLAFPYLAQLTQNFRAGCMSLRRPRFFDSIERAIRRLLGCQQDAESFLSAEHGVVGEIADGLARAYAALGMACVCFLLQGTGLPGVPVRTLAPSGSLPLSLSAEAALPSTYLSCPQECSSTVGCGSFLEPDCSLFTGDWQKSATHLQKSLRVVEVRHGPSSVEMGHELFKLAQVFFNG